MAARGKHNDSILELFNLTEKNAADINGKGEAMETPHALRTELRHIRDLIHTIDANVYDVREIIDPQSQHAAFVARCLVPWQSAIARLDAVQDAFRHLPHGDVRNGCRRAWQTLSARLPTHEKLVTETFR